MQNKQTILLTGATVFLGRLLLKQVKSYNLIIVGNEMSVFEING